MSDNELDVVTVEDEKTPVPTAPNKTAEEKAREEAEARRLRILRSSNERMGIVEGTLPKPSYEKDQQESAGTDDENQPSATETASAAAAVSGSAKATSSSAAARMAAMRRRRFQKKGGAADTGANTQSDEAKNPAEPVGTEGTTTTTTTTDGETSSAVTTDKVTESVATPAAAEEEEEVKPEPPAVVAQEATNNPEEVPVEETIPAADTSSKKYQGVAKMRRRMIKEKQQNKGQDQDEGSKEEPEALKKAKERALRSFTKNKPSHSKVPLFMSVVTVLLLFLAGLDVGLHQGELDYGLEKELVTVHTELAPRKLGERIQNILDKRRQKNSKKATFEPAQEIPAQPVEEESDEFADIQNDKKTVPVGAAEENIDPLFGVDLDKLTTGTGFYFATARFAVKCHRANLAIFYFLPRKVFTSILGGLMQLIQSPPMFCLIAIVIRQFIGKTILGAHIPKSATAIEEEKQNQQNKDVVSMGKKFVSNMLAQSFPTAFYMYDVWTHLRSDMYIILCGFLVGVAYMHTETKLASSSTTTISSEGSDEL